MAKSLAQAGQVKMRGKRTKMMLCQCCECVNFKEKLIANLAKKEMRDAVAGIGIWIKPGTLNH